MRDPRDEIRTDEPVPAGIEDLQDPDEVVSGDEPETVHIHFMHDVESLDDDAFRCERCGFEGTKREIYHRRMDLRPIVTRCTRRRIQQWWRDLW